MKPILRQIRGVLVFSGFTVNTILWFVPLFLLALIKLLLPIAAWRRAVTRILMAIGENWISVNSAILTGTGSIDCRTHGMDKLSRGGWYLIMVNHQSWVDVLLLQKVFNRRIPFLKFFIKRQLIWFPFLGLAWWALDMPFMKRYSPAYLARNPHMKGGDLETTRRACKKFSYTPTAVINFLEGTRFSAEKRDTRNSPYRHLLMPRAGGFAVAMGSMGHLFDAILDVTLVYQNEPTGFWDMCCGDRVFVDVYVRKRTVEKWLVSGDYQQDRDFRRRVHRWLGQIWQEKDDLLQQMLDTSGSQ